MKRIYPIEENCVACKLCEVACIVEHSKSKSVFLAWKEKPAILARNTVFEEKAVSFSAMCRHCEEAECINACPNNAVHKDERGYVVVDSSRCQACWMCLMSCRYMSIKPYINKEPQTKVTIKFSNKCDLCPEREIPACVEACPNGALIFEDKDIQKEDDVTKEFEDDVVDI